MNAWPTRLFVRVKLLEEEVKYILWPESALCHRSAEQRNLWPTELDPARKRGLFFFNKVLETLGEASQAFENHEQTFLITRNDWTKVTAT